MMAGSLKRRWTRLAAVAGAGTALAIVVVGVLASAGSAASAQAPANTSPPTVSGTPQQGKTLTGHRGTWTGSGIDFNYFWTRCDRNGGSCANISNAEKATYTLTSADVGNTVRFKVQAKNGEGTVFASSVPSAVIQAAPKPQAPANTGLPTVAGTAQVGQKLTGSRGSWSGNPTDYDYFWTRCDKNGTACSNIPGATGATYTLASSDLGTTVRFKVEAKNANGGTFASSAHTAVVSAAPPPEGSAIPVSQVSAPARLVVDKVRFSPNPARPHRAIVARFHVSDTRGYTIQGALVYALGLPYSWVRNGAESPTNASGWATIVLRPTSAMPFHRGGSLVVFVRARKPGDNLLSGVSSRRLVQARVSS
jgi:hypothetical protein